MVIKILYLYKNLMNIYGEYANILVLKKHLEDQAINVQVVYFESLDNVNLLDYDMLYIGSGTEKNQKQSLADLQKNKHKVVEYYNNNKIALLTGNSFEMLGKSIKDADNVTYDGLGILDFTVVEQNEKRYTSDAIAECRFLSSKIVGFINKCSTITGINDSINEIVMGFGNDNVSKQEGIRTKNFFGTHFIGPVLVKNPELMKYFVELLAQNKDDSFKYKDTDYTYENSAYAVTLQKLSERLESNN